VYRALERIANVNIRMARLMSEFLQLVNPSECHAGVTHRWTVLERPFLFLSDRPRPLSLTETSEAMARVDLHDPTGCVELARVRWEWQRSILRAYNSA
jgi:hypothetical protein